MPRAKFFDSPSDWRDWLKRHHRQRDEVSVGLYTKASSRPTITWDEVVDEALCFGWIDGVRHTIDDTSWRVRLTPRRPGSRWSAKNVARARELIAAGRMREPGQVAFDARRPDDHDGYRPDRTELPAAAQALFEANAPAWSFFSAQPPGYRKKAARWIMSAKKEDTRRRRLDTLIENSANGLRLGPLRRPSDRRRQISGTEDAPKSRA